MRNGLNYAQFLEAILRIILFKSEQNEGKGSTFKKLLEELFIGAEKKEDLSLSSEHNKRDFDLQYRASKDDVFKSLYEYMSLKDR